MLYWLAGHDLNHQWHDILCLHFWQSCKNSKICEHLFAAKLCLAGVYTFKIKLLEHTDCIEHRAYVYFNILDSYSSDLFLEQTILVNLYIIKWCSLTKYRKGPLCLMINTALKLRALFRLYYFEIESPPHEKRIYRCCDRYMARQLGQCYHCIAVTSATIA